MEEFNISRVIPEFEDEKVNECIKNISVNLFSENHIVDSLIYNVYLLRKLIKEKTKIDITEFSDVQTENGQVKASYDFYDVMIKIFGFKKRSIQKILACSIFLNSEVILGNKNQIVINASNVKNCFLFNCFRGFTLSKLFELLPLKEKAKEYCEEGYLTPDYTVQELRIKVQELLGKEVTVRDKNINDFDLNEEYTLNDFKTRWTKTGLIDIAFSLYTNYKGYLLGKKK